MLARSYVTRVDSIFRKRPRAFRILLEEDVTVIVKVTDDGHRYATRAKSLNDLRHSFSRLARVYCNSDKLGAGASQLLNLQRGPCDVDRVGVCHRLDDYRVAAPHSDAVDVNRDRTSSTDV